MRREVEFIQDECERCGDRVQQRGDHTCQSCADALGRSVHQPFWGAFPNHPDANLAISFARDVASAASDFGRDVSTAAHHFAADVRSACADFRSDLRGQRPEGARR